jgi:hypothetical protein
MYSVGNKSTFSRIKDPTPPTSSAVVNSKSNWSMMGLSNALTDPLREGNFWSFEKYIVSFHEILNES